MHAWVTIMSREGEVFIGNVKKTVSEIRAEMERLDDSISTSVIRGMSERVTQELLKLDAVPSVNKQALGEAYRANDKAEARKIAMLIGRRKTLIKELNQLGEDVDKLLASREAPSSMGKSCDTD